jgi:hypothetical protein
MRIGGRPPALAIMPLAFSWEAMSAAGWVRGLLRDAARIRRTLRDGAVCAREERWTASCATVKDET